MHYKSLVIAALLLSTTTCFSQTWGNYGSRTDYRSDAGLQGNQGAISGFYETPAPINFPAGATSWWHLLDVRHSNAANNYAMQFSGSFFDQNLYFRKTNDNAATSWNRVVMEDPNGVASAGRMLTSSVAYADNDRFNYNNGSNNYSVHNYGMEWNADSWAAGYGPTAYLSGFGGIKFFTGSNYRMCITVQGNIGIGTSNPPEKLSVEGTIASRRVKVTQANWPDYVFDRHYSLRNLDAVEAFITQNKHLPDVPAAAQITTDGLDIGENQAALLRKVEELTLYVIQLNKAVRQLQIENKHYKRTIARLVNKK